MHSPYRQQAWWSFVVAWACASLLSILPAWQISEERVFDEFSVLTAPLRTQLPIVIVGIDDASMAQLQRLWPWPREWHARALQKLKASGAALIAMDVIFVEPSLPADDAALTTAIQQSGPIVLAADYAFHETASTRQWLRLDPMPALTTAGALSGLVTQELSSTGMVRQFSSYPDAFWRIVVQEVISVFPQIGQQPFIAPGALIRHLGPAHTFPYVSYYQVLANDPSIPEGFFQDKVVLIGRDLRSGTDVQQLQSDSFATPFLATSKQLTPGVEIQATMIENALMGQAILPAPAWQNQSAIVGLLLLALPFLWHWNPVRSLAGVALIAAGFLGFSIWLFQYHNLYLATASPLVGLALAMITMIGMSSYAERRRARDIRNAFSRYVAPEVVNEMIAHPERLRAGGHRRDVSILFCDLAGFTSLSENLAPEVVTRVINVYLSAVTKVIMAHHGMVDKFIGDAAMAIWGAPLDDPQHANHALDAAIAMDQAMRALAPTFLELGAGPITLRIGLNSGTAVVGNMGSELRFDYTAIGDTVNLASRLEGANKAYGTPILLGETTLDRLTNHYNLRRVDRIRVKGKAQAVNVFSPCDDMALIASTDTAWTHYTARDWSACQLTWQHIASHWPTDPLASVFLARLNGLILGETTLPDDLSVALDKL